MHTFSLGYQHGSKHTSTDPTTYMMMIFTHHTTKPSNMDPGRLEHMNAFQPISFQPHKNARVWQPHRFKHRCTAVVRNFCLLHSKSPGQLPQWAASTMGRFLNGSACPLMRSLHCFLLFLTLYADKHTPLPGTVSTIEMSTPLTLGCAAASVRACNHRPPKRPQPCMRAKAKTAASR